MATTNNYDASSIKNLQFPESIRAKPSLYVGELGNDALFHLFKEAAENVVDEALGKHCDQCTVELGTDGSITVYDNGRGIPFGKTKIGDQLRGGHSLIPTLKAVVSFTHTSGKFGGEAYAASRGCFVGETAIQLLNGKVVTMDWLYRRWQKNKSLIPVQTWNVEKDELAFSNISHVQKTMLTKNLVDVTVGSKIIRCTPDHPFYVRTAKGIRKVRADKLKPGISLVSRHMEYDGDGYLYDEKLGVRSPKGRQHREVYAFYHPDEDLQGFQVHHKNRNRADNRPSNLERVTSRQHQEEHFEEKSEFSRSKMMEDLDARTEKSALLSGLNQEDWVIAEQQRTKSIDTGVRVLLEGKKITGGTYNKYRRYGAVKWENLGRYFSSVERLIDLATEAFASANLRAKAFKADNDYLEDVKSYAVGGQLVVSYEASKSAAIKLAISRLESIKDPRASITPKVFDASRGGKGFMGFGVAKPTTATLPQALACVTASAELGVATLVMAKRPFNWSPYLFNSVVA